MNNIFTQQPNYLWGTICLTGMSLTDSPPEFHLNRKNLKKITRIGYLNIGNQEISFDKRPSKFQLFLFKKLGFKWNDEFPHPVKETEEELINQRRYEILDEILNKNIFYRLKQKTKQIFVIWKKYIRQ